ncbi:MAG TPA: SGNH/GDSL hydrolase family protein [Myxococcota bacterium]
MSAAPKVVIIGDSHVEALGPQLKRRLGLLGVNVIGFTYRRGWSTGRYNRARDVARLVLKHGRPDVVVLSLGGNGRPRSRSGYEKILIRMVRAVRSTGVEHIVWNGPPTSLAAVSKRSADAARRHEQNAEWQRELLPAMGVCWVDSRPMTKTGHARDGVHFTLRTGYPAWADQLAHELSHAVRKCMGLPLA